MLDATWWVLVTVVVIVNTENSICLARLAPDTSDTARLPYLVWRHYDAPDSVIFEYMIDINNDTIKNPFEHPKTYQKILNPVLTVQRKQKCD